MAENKFERVEPDDPLRCQANTVQNQCPFKRCEGSLYCPMHGGNKKPQAEEADQLRVYRLTKWRSRVNEIADNDKVKSLREEIGILRIMLEEIVNKCDDGPQLILYSSKIADIVLKVEKLVSSCHRLEASTGMLLDKSAALNLATQIVEIIGRHVTDEDIIDRISGEIVVAVANLKPEVKSGK